MMLANFLTHFATFSVVILCIVLKLPQILSILKSKSIQGINVKSVLMEQFGYTTMLCYSYSQGYSFSSYAEYVFLVAQDALLIAILLHHLSLLNLNSAALFGLFLAYELGLGFEKFPQWMTVASINICIPISAGSKALQLKTILDNKDAGQVNALSWAIAAYTCIARIYTGLMITGDIIILVNLTINLALNLAITSAAIYYKGSTLPGPKKMA